MQSSHAASFPILVVTCAPVKIEDNNNKNERKKEDNVRRS